MVPFHFSPHIAIHCGTQPLENARWVFFHGGPIDVQCLRQAKQYSTAPQLHILVLVRS